MSMKPQITPIVPIAALVVATLAAGATMWHGLFGGAAGSTTARGAVSASKAGADEPARQPDGRRDDAARQPSSAGVPAPK
jgi:hypothetical protein